VGRLWVEGLVRRVWRVETRVVFPAPWMPFRPIMKGDGVVGEGEEAWERWEERRERMKGMQWEDLSSIMAGLVVVDILKDYGIVRASS
jgi:hypothetical protein